MPTGARTSDGQIDPQLPLTRSGPCWGSVKYDPACKTRPFQLQVFQKSMGYYSTAEEAALAYSRSVGKEAAEREADLRFDSGGRCRLGPADVWAPQMTPAEVMAAADAEGLALVQSKENKCGYLCVSARDGAFDVKMPANALVTGEDRQVRRTRFRTVEAAALAVRRRTL